MYRLVCVLFEVLVLGKVVIVPTDDSLAGDSLAACRCAMRIRTRSTIKFLIPLLDASTLVSSLVSKPSHTVRCRINHKVVPKFWPLTSTAGHLSACK